MTERPTTQSPTTQSPEWSDPSARSNARSQDEIETIPLFPRSLRTSRETGRSRRGRGSRSDVERRSQAQGGVVRDDDERSGERPDESGGQRIGCSPDDRAAGGSRPLVRLP
jgi:hypothetical protein